MPAQTVQAAMPRTDSHGNPVPIKGRRVLNWYDEAERNHYIYRLTHRRSHKCTMRCPLIYFPCFWCGRSCWARRMDIFPVCDSCRPSKNAARNSMAAKLYRAHHPETQKQTDRRSYHVKQETKPMRPYRDRRDYLKTRHASKDEWRRVLDRESGRRMGERQTDMRRYACAFAGRHHRNRRIDVVVVRSRRLRRERT